MGYTHYWEFEEFISEKAYKNALRDCRKIIKASPVTLGNAHGGGNPNLNNGIWINGFSSERCETFALGSTPIRKHCDPNKQGFNFCKTRHKPYDVVVTACLTVLQYYLGKQVSVRSDGDPHEWEDGKALANKILNKEFSIPQDVIDQVNCYGWYAKQYRKEHPEYNYTPLDISHPNHKNERVPEYAKG